jgi:hypothetical protein
MLFPPHASYTSDQAHSSIKKACMVTGIDVSKLRVLDTSATDFRMTGASVAEAIAADVAKGLIPIAVFATMGTTSSCVFDPLEDIGAVCEEVWDLQPVRIMSSCPASNRTRTLWQYRRTVDRLIAPPSLLLSLPLPARLPSP